MNDLLHSTQDPPNSNLREREEIQRRKSKWAPTPMRRTSWRRSDDGRILEGIIDFKHENFVTTESLAGAANLVTLRRVTEEYKFWELFFKMISTLHDDLHTKFVRRVESTEMESGLIYWDFWAGRQSYIYALEKAIKRIEMDWKFPWDKTQTLLKLAQMVIETRRCELKPSSPSYHKHLNVYNKWILLEKILRDKEPPSPLVEFFVNFLVTLGSLFAGAGGVKSKELNEKKPIWEIISWGIALIVQLIQYFVFILVGFFILTAILHLLLILIPQKST